MIDVVAPFLLLLAPANDADPAGVWDYRTAGTVMFEFDIRRTPAGGSAEWLRPATFESDQDAFTKVEGPVVRRRARSVSFSGNCVELTFDDPAPGALPDRFRICAQCQSTAEADYIGSRAEPFALDRAQGRTVIGGWNPKLVYKRTLRQDWPINLAMTTLFDDDQNDRKGANVDPQELQNRDRVRRQKTLALIEADLLRSGNDFYHAALIFQHGETSDDFLKAHVLATISMARGNRAAAWLTAATLDRYLQSLGQPQILGTQYLPSGDRRNPFTEEPFDRSLLPDSLRRALNVPGLDDQEAQRKAYGQMTK